MSPNSPSPPVGGMIFARLLATQTLPEASICTAARCWIALFRKPVPGDRTVPAEAPAGQAAVFTPHSSDTEEAPNPATHTRSVPSTATDQGSTVLGSWYTPATVPLGRI